MSPEMKIIFLALCFGVCASLFIAGCSPKGSVCNCNGTVCEGNCECGCRVHAATDGFSGAIIAIENEPTAAMPMHVLNTLKTARDHMQQLQGSPYGSDNNARALFAVMQAIDALEGTVEVSSTIEITDEPDTRNVP